MHERGLVAADVVEQFRLWACDESKARDFAKEHVRQRRHERREMEMAEDL
jgi:hypothetical protein